MLNEDLKSVYDQINIADAHFSIELYLSTSFWLQSQSWASQSSEHYFALSFVSCIPKYKVLCDYLGVFWILVWFFKKGSRSGFVRLMFGLGYHKVLFQPRWFYVSKSPTLCYSPFYFHSLSQRSTCYLVCFCLLLVHPPRNVLSVFLLYFSQVSFHFLLSYWKPREAMPFIFSFNSYFYMKLS